MKTELAIRYNNKSVLESYSCTLAMELITKHKLLSRLKRPLSADQVRTSIIKMILATDMVFHYELQENLANLLEILSDRAEDVAEQDEEAELQVKDIFESKGDKSPLDNFDMQSYMEGNASSTTVARSNSPMSGKSLNSRERQMLCQIVLHAADISNALRPWPICERWSDLVCEEFFRQGDEERKHGLPLSPNMDRSQVTQSTIGLQFGDFVVSPYFEIFAAMFPAAEEMLNVLKANRTEWLKREQEEAKAKAHSVPPDHPTSSGAATTGLHGRQPEDMLPDQSILNPSGRRVSVAAGMIIIPDELEERVVGSGKTKRKYLGLRSISDTGIPDTVARGSTGRSTPVETLRATEKIHNGRRRSEEPGYYLYRHRLKIVSRRSSRRYSRSDIVDKCLEQQCQIASTTSSPWCILHAASTVIYTYVRIFSFSFSVYMRTISDFMFVQYICTVVFSLLLLLNLYMLPLLFPMHIMEVRWRWLYGHVNYPNHFSYYLGGCHFACVLFFILLCCIRGRGLYQMYSMS